MIKIGINDNIYLEKASVDEKGTIDLHFQEVNAKEKPKGLFADVAGDDIVEGQDGLTIKLFSPLPPKKEDMTEEKKVDLVGLDIKKSKSILQHLLLGYYTKADLTGFWASGVYAGLPVDANNLESQILKPEILTAIHKNMGKMFVDKIRPFLNDKNRAFRLLLVRQSKDKHYASLRGKFVEDNPFWEDMSIPKEATKLKFTDYEIREGLNNDTPISREAAADSKAGNAAAAAGGAPPTTVGNVFAGQQ